MDMHTTFARSEAWRAARQGEVAFITIARALRVLATELGERPDDVVGQMIVQGLPATLGDLAQRSGRGDVHACFNRCHAGLQLH